MSDPGVCNRSWHSPRYDVPGSVPVLHVCCLTVGHDGQCGCACQLAPRWSWFDSRTGQRTTSSTFLTRESAEAQLNFWCSARAQIRPDLADLASYMEVREL